MSYPMQWGTQWGTQYTVGVGGKKSTPYTVVTQCMQQVLVQKGQTSVCSTQVTVVYGGEDIVFGAKRSNQRRQWMQYTVAYWYLVVGTLSGFSGCSHTVDTVHCVTASTGLNFLPHIPLFHCILHPLHPLVWPFCTKDNVPTTIYHYSTVYCIHCILWFDLFVSKTMSPQPYTIILLHPLHPLCTVSTVWLHPLNPLVWPFCI